MKKKPVLIITGPTGVGKSKLAVAVCKQIRGEIISCDSMQVYRGLNIGTDKPSLALRKQVPHHLINEISPGKEFSVYDFRQRALCLIEEIYQRKRWPVLAGGTGLYVKALVRGISPQPGVDPVIRERLQQESARGGLERMFERLRQLDPVCAARIHPHDEKRILRALEVLEISGKSLSEWEKQTVGLRELGYEYVLCGVEGERGQVYQAIDKRVDEMFSRGLEKEARKYYGRLSRTSSQAIGYRELFRYFAGELSLEEARAEIKKNTRHFAKRQWTLFRHMENIIWISGNPEERKHKILRLLENL